MGVVRTGTTNWVNNSRLNGNTNLLGPGVIVPPVNIAFNQLSSWVISTEPNPEANAFPQNHQWGFFDQSTNPPIRFPGFAFGTAYPLQLTLRLYSSGIPLLNYTWEMAVPIGGAALLQTSTNLLDWLQVSTVTNTGGVVEWLHFGALKGNRFFRVTPLNGRN